MKLLDHDVFISLGQMIKPKDSTRKSALAKCVRIQKIKKPKQGRSIIALKKPLKFIQKQGHSDTLTSGLKQEFTKYSTLVPVNRFPDKNSRYLYNQFHPEWCIKLYRVLKFQIKYIDILLHVFFFYICFLTIIKLSSLINLYHGF
jgi:hypothetical protein